MSKHLLTILIAGADLWAALFATQILRQRPTWEVSMAISDRAAPVAITATDPIQIWVRADAIGLWPDVDRPLTIPQISQVLERRAEQDRTRRMEMRLLCDPKLTIDNWSQVALAIAPHVDEIRIAPLIPAK